MAYKITIRETFFDVELSGWFKTNSEADAKEQAIAEAQEHFAKELGTTPDDIEIIKVEFINDNI